VNGFRSPVVVCDGISIPMAEIEFSAMRAQGAGGQKVNKTSSAVQLRFDVNASKALPQSWKQRLLAVQDQRITADGVIVIKAQEFRTQSMNRNAAVERLCDLIVTASKTPKARKATRPSHAVKRRRLEDKRRRGQVKRQRRISDD